MKAKWLLVVTMVVMAVGGLASQAADMGTAITYQGDLAKLGTPVTDSCDFLFGLWDAAGSGDPPTGGALVPVTLPAVNPAIHLGVSVTNGLFIVNDLDFGNGAFNGAARWLEIGVRCPAGAGIYAPLTPRVELTPAPHALALPGLYTQQNAISPNLIGGYSGNAVSSGVEGGTINGGGASGIINRVTDGFGTVGGGASNRAGNDAGTTSDAPYSTVGGGEGNAAGGNRSTIGGGFANNTRNWASTVSGGDTNTANASWSTVGGGYYNTASGDYSFVGGGQQNTASGNATVAGGVSNAASGAQATVGGGFDNTASMWYSTVGGGGLNTASGPNSTVGGGESNTASAYQSTVGGGGSNTATGYISTVGGGSGNAASFDFSTVGGGQQNTASGKWSIVGGGGSNTANGESSTVSGGISNMANAWYSTVGGGFDSTAGEVQATVGGGCKNIASGQRSTVSGGYTNTASAYGATVPGGNLNEAGGRNSFAGGNQAHVRGIALGDPADDDGTFIWADNQGLDFFSSGINQFLIRAAGGVGIGTNAPEAPLHVQGTKILLDTYGGAPQFTARTALGSPSGRGAVGNGQTLVQLAGLGFDGTTYSNGGGWIEIATAQAWTSTNHGTTMMFATTPKGSSTRNERMRIDPDGNIGIGTTQPTAKLHVVAPAGNASVVLPTDSISSGEILDEPGIASTWGGWSWPHNPPTTEVLAQSMIYAPGAGYVLATATVQTDGIVGPQALATFWISGPSQTNSPDYFSSFSAPGNLDYYQAGVVSFHEVFPVSEGPNAFTFWGEYQGGEFRISAHRLTLIYFPTAYGAVDPPPAFLTAQSLEGPTPDETGQPMLLDAGLHQESGPLPATIAAENRDLAELEERNAQLEARVATLEAMMSKVLAAQNGGGR